ncbi:citrate-binding protein-like [Vigna umbellata]|uniref:citrate-binding protein-like n=1 Tax=Vigna umbellata TaxID=87088 RepID=UPI001F5F7BC2|nr:citrate-binding protein-like [Vigna umbellata]
MVSQPIFHQALLPFLFCITTLSLVVADPTDGFTRLPSPSSNFQIQKHYDLPQNKCYTFSNGVYRFWVYTNDTSSTGTRARCELRIGNYYTSGVLQFEGYFYIPNGTTGTTIHQVVSSGVSAAAATATTSQSRVYHGSLTHFLSPTLETNIYDKWYRFNLIHDVGANNLKIFINGVQKFNGNGQVAGSHYMKIGVYAHEGASHYVESRWRNIKLFTR